MSVVGAVLGFASLGAIVVRVVVEDWRSPEMRQVRRIRRTRRRPIIEVVDGELARLVGVVEPFGPFEPAATDASFLLRDESGVAEVTLEGAVFAAPDEVSARILQPGARVAVYGRIRRVADATAAGGYREAASRVVVVEPWITNEASMLRR
jgi:hypothetical protein